MLNYRDRPKRRMEKQGFPHDDQLLEVVREAGREVFDVHLKLHYLSCDGAGRTGKE